MSATTPLLSICIATRNRAPYLREMLESLAAQWNSTLELVIVDGASTDETPAVVTSLRPVFGRLTYIHLDAKGGVDQDYHRAILAAKSKYCWLLTDDDVVSFGAIAAVQATLARNPSLVIVNAAVRDSRLDALVTERQLEFDSDREYLPGSHERLFVETAGYLSFIGAVVVERALWLSRTPERFFGSWFIHVGVIFHAPLPKPAIALAKPYIQIRAANASWSDRYFEIWMFRWPNLIWSIGSLSDMAKQAVVSREPWRRPGALLICRAKGAYDLSVYRRWVVQQLEPGARRWLAWLIAATPGPFVNALALAFFRLFRPWARGDMLDFRVSSEYWLATLRAWLTRRSGLGTSRARSR